MSTSNKALKVASAQINTTVGDIQGNVEKILAAREQALAHNVDLVVTPELSVSGYPLQDMVEEPDLLRKCEEAIAFLTEISKDGGPAMLVGYPEKAEEGKAYNSVVMIQNGKILGKVQKKHLPNNDVFDEVRNFKPGIGGQTFTLNGHRFGVLICEDTWHPDVAEQLNQKGADFLISVNASPFHTGKAEHIRLPEVVSQRAKETGLPLLYVNQIGGQDEVVFDGASFAVDGQGTLSFLAPAWQESLDILEARKNENGQYQFYFDGKNAEFSRGYEEIWQALVLGLRDYLNKNGFKEVVLGMSGGIDSAIVAAIAADAIGGDKVHLFSLPSKYTADISNSDAAEAARMLGAPIASLAIESGVQALESTLAPHFNGKQRDATEENLQARLRGLYLMSLSNKHNWLLLTTGNKSEVSVGYCTLYGDMNGGFNPIKDVWKTTVFELAKWRNQNVPANVLGPKGPVMPDNIITRPPSAELSPDQKDSDNLPPYEILDDILRRQVEQRQGLDDIAAETGYDMATIEKVIKLRYRAIFKQYQAAPGTKISIRSYGLGDRNPMAAKNIVAIRHMKLERK